MLDLDLATIGRVLDREHRCGSLPHAEALDVQIPRAQLPDGERR